MRLLRTVFQWTIFVILVIVLFFISIVLGIVQNIEDRKARRKQPIKDTR